jgi:long-chain fatty acid transport protein
MSRLHRETLVTKLVLIVLALWLAMLGPRHAVAAGILLYEVGTAEVGLAAAGRAARAQDASTVLTNPAGMTRLEGSQFLLGAQALYGDYGFSIGPETSPGLGTGDGGNPVSWFPGGGAFFTYSISPDLKLGFAVTGNFGLSQEYDDNWVGRYYVQKDTILGVSFLPSIAYKATDKLSLGASLNAMYGKFDYKMAINIPDALRPGVIVPILRSTTDARLELEDEVWGWGVNLGLLYEFTENTRVGLTWNSQVNLDFKTQAEFSNLGALGAALQSRGLLNPNIDVGINVPQQITASVFHQVNSRLALLGSVGWQEWSKFGKLEIGIENTADPRSLTRDIEFKDAWHFAAGAQYRLSDPWLLNFGVAYDSEIQSGSTVTPVLPVNDAWRFGAGVENQVSKGFSWGVAAEYAYGGSLDVKEQSVLPVELGGRGDLVGSYPGTGIFFLAVNFMWKF